MGVQHVVIFPVITVKKILLRIRLSESLVGKHCFDLGFILLVLGIHGSSDFLKLTMNTIRGVCQTSCDSIAEAGLRRAWSGNNGYRFLRATTAGTASSSPSGVIVEQRRKVPYPLAKLTGTDARSSNILLVLSPRLRVSTGVG